MNIIHSKELFDGGEGMEAQNDQKNLLTVSKGHSSPYPIKDEALHGYSVRRFGRAFNAVAVATLD
jgi:hypothetical protein